MYTLNQSLAYHLARQCGAEGIYKTSNPNSTPKYQTPRRAKRLQSEYQTIEKVVQRQLKSELGHPRCMRRVRQVRRQWHVVR